MGYQEYIYKVGNTKKFIKNKDIIDKYIKTILIEQVDYSFIEFKEKLENIEPGFYMYIYGERSFGGAFLKALNKQLGCSSYSTCIEDAMNCYNKNNEIASKKLKDLFKNKSTKTGRIICKYERGRDYEKNQRQL
ncbi:hypothetical protein [Clostridium gasigenes]|uniref:hypothetical protein n=1 Tax=Clostridium gasigenes TaxID=94869 RepID=UPI001C0AFF7F|nr:hypothetical protein [Clostridium gasigenes]MBU3107123.1 hypothetical protein [Clostridium gasigenes]